MFANGLITGIFIGSVIGFMGAALCCMARNNDESNMNYGGTMPRNMSFSLTTRQIINREKYVTRRLGWGDLKPGDVVHAVEKCMGLKKGEKVKKLAVIRIISTREERLDAISQHDCELEGFPSLTPDAFVMMFCKHNKCEPWTRVNRIAFDYVG